MSISRRQARTIARKAVKRVAEGESISHLNIMPMMDIMTVLLIAFLFQSVTGASAMAVGNVNLPTSRTYTPIPAGAVVVTISDRAILVEGQPVVPVKNGSIDPSLKKDGALGIEIPKLARFLGMVRGQNVARLRNQGKTPPKKPELVIIADKATRYRLLFEVIVSSRSEVAGYRGFRLIVIRPSAAAG
ncbi:MAG TPA: biopolymer transporter ExbD [Kofleriaceae bacterium]|nr:biopolymer transporter ExbD [Kofleriaceae bacterium]